MAKRASTPVREAPRSSLYDVDFHGWTQRTAALLRQRRFDEIDVDQAATEIEDMGKRDARELSSRLEVLIAHLLKWQFQSRQQRRSWRTTIVTQRLAIAKLLSQSPSLRPRLATGVADSYRGAVRLAAVDTGCPPGDFPRDCPYAIEQLLDDDYLPE